MPHHENWTGYDVIGDVHGHADALIELLSAMEHVERDGVWAHQDRQAIFVGDLIDTPAADRPSWARSRWFDFDCCVHSESK